MFRLLRIPKRSVIALTLAMGDFDEISRSQMRDSSKDIYDAIQSNLKQKDIYDTSQKKLEDRFHPKFTRDFDGEPRVDRITLTRPYSYRVPIRVSYDRDNIVNDLIQN